MIFDILHLIIPTRQRYAQTLLLGLLTLTIGCKKGDNTPPTISVSNPVDGTAATGTDRVTIRGSASDEGGLTQITAQLLSVPDERIFGTQIETVSGTSADFAFEMELGDRYTPTGDYLLRVSATDEAGNFASDWIDLQLTELPRVRHRTLWAGDDGAGTFTLFGRDTLGNTTSGTGLGQAVSALHMDNRSQTLLVTNAASGNFTAYRPEDFSQRFSLGIAANGNNESWTGISSYLERYYLSSVVPPYFRVYNSSGDLITTFDDALHPALSVLTTETRLYGGVRGLVGQPLKLDAYGRNSTQLQVTNVLNREIHQVHATTNHIAAVHLAGQNGRIYLLDGQSLVTLDSIDFSSPLLHTAYSPENDLLYVLTDLGLQTLDPDLAWLSPVTVSGTFSCVAVDRSSGDVYLGRQDVVEILDAQLSPKGMWQGGFGDVSYIDFHYNK